MILKNQEGIIVTFTETKTKAGKPMIIIAHTLGNSDKLQKIFLFEDDEMFKELSVLGNDLIGTKIATKTEIIQQ